MYELLETIDAPAALRKLDRRQLQTLAEDLRAFVLESVSRTGGHLSSNLGTIELAIALHYVYDTPYDRIVWDVGHQTYPHKILTGRREAMARLRMWGGISGFPSRAESEFDCFGTAHSSTSISAALGMAEAARIKGEARHVVAVIGDGAMSGGMAFEAMNNAGVSETDLLVILNDNEMSISPAVGALNRYLARLITGPYAAARNAGKRILGGAPGLAGLARRAEEHVKGMLVPSTLFEEFGFHYFGPIDGHDLDSLIPTLRNIKNQRGPRLLHVITKKGQGYKLAEADPVAYHGVSKFQPEAGLATARGAGKLTYTQVFGDWLCDMAARDPRLVGITPAMREGSGLVRFQQEYPGRYFDVGIAEQHAVTFAAGLACDGMKPVLAIYSTFLQRGYDQLIHDVCIQNLPVLFALDRAGFVGPDGATHHGAFDLTYLRCLPNMTIMTPADENECRQMLYTGFTLDGPSAVRYPRGSGAGVAVQKEMTALPLGKAQIRRNGRGVVILSFGSLLGSALAAGDILDATVVNMRFVKPLDESMVHEMAAVYDLVVTLEENMVAGGAGSAVSELLAASRVRVEVLQLGMPDKFVEQGDQQQLLTSVGLDTDAIVRAIRLRMGGRRLAARA